MTVHPASSSKKSIVILLLSAAVSIFWLLGLFVNVYRSAFVGAIFEILWLPAIALGVFLPVRSVISWSREKFQFSSPYFYSILLLLSTILLLLLFKK